MLYIDQKYLLILSPSLERFADKGDNVYNCRCPICGDSSKNKLKARGYFYETNGELYYKCHNCTFASSFSNLLKGVDPTLYSQYSLERLSDKRLTQPKQVKPKDESKFKSIDLVDAFHSGDDVARYGVSRGFTENQLKRVYSCPNFRQWAVERFGSKYEKVSESQRLVLPFFDIEGNLVGGQGRAIDPNNKFRYETVKHPDVEGFVFGLDRWNRNKTTKVVEGPIDSLFLENGLAVASSDLKRVFKVLPQLNREDTILCWDNEPRNKEIIKLMEGAIQSGFRIFIWPSLPCKDLNDAVNLGIDIESVICNNNFSGLSAKLKFMEWKKI